MYDFRYVTKAECAYARTDLENLIHNVQDEVRKHFTFQYQFVGSAKYNLITMDYSSNAGFDFDVNLIVNNNSESYSAKEIKLILRNAFDRFTNNTSEYGYCEDSTRVLTIKVKDKRNSRILHSADFAIVRNCPYDKQPRQCIYFNKWQQYYHWQSLTKFDYELQIKVKTLKKHNLWNDVREKYINKKNYNFLGKKSYSLFKETINEVYQRNFTQCPNSHTVTSPWFFSHYSKPVIVSAASYPYLQSLMRSPFLT